MNHLFFSFKNNGKPKITICKDDIFLAFFCLRKLLNFNKLVECFFKLKDVREFCLELNG